MTPTIWVDNNPFVTANSDIDFFEEASSTTDGYKRSKNERTKKLDRRVKSTVLVLRPYSASKGKGERGLII